MIAEEKVDLPIDMPGDYAALIKGLIKPQRKERFGNEQVRKWLKGEAIAIDSKKSDTVYNPLKFSRTESAANPKELADLMEKYPDIGKTCLYDGIIKDWLKEARDMMLYNEIQNITSRYASDKEAGLYMAILALDPERPFKSRGGKICKTSEDIADALMAESAYYMEELKKQNANLYLYLAATESSQGKEAADAFCKYLKEYSPKRALALGYLKLQSDGGITIGENRYQSPDELRQEKDGGQIALVKKAVTEKDSTLLVWLSDIYRDNLNSTDEFSKLSIQEQFFLIGLLPFLSYKEYKSGSYVLQNLIDTCPGRADLFETYAAQGLPLTGKICAYAMTLIDYTVCNFNGLSQKHGVDSIHNLIRLLIKLGADVNEYSGDGSCPLINAYNAKNNALVKLLLELGADENQYLVYKERVDEQERIERERREEKERIEMERRAEEERLERQWREEQEREKKRLEEGRKRQEAENARIEQQQRKKEEAEEKRKKRAKRFRGFMFTFGPVIIGMVIHYISLKDEFHEDLLTTLLAGLILYLVFGVVPLLIIHIRNWWGFFSVASIIVFWLALLPSTFLLAEVNTLSYWGSLAMVAAFIMACAYPKDKYWD
jgi:hypothetical protein